MSSSQTKEWSKVQQIEFGNAVGDLGVIEVTCVPQQILDYLNCVFAAHLPSFLIEPFRQFVARNGVRLGKDRVQYSWTSSPKDELMQVLRLLRNHVD